MYQPNTKKTITKMETDAVPDYINISSSHDAEAEDQFWEDWDYTNTKRCTVYKCYCACHGSDSSTDEYEHHYLEPDDCDWTPPAGIKRARPFEEETPGVKKKRKLKHIGSFREE